MKNQAASMLPPSGERADPATGSPGWRNTVHDHARQVWLHAVARIKRGETALPPGGDAWPAGKVLPGSLSGEAKEILDSYTIGAAAQAVANGSASEEPPAEFISRLDLILDGLAQSAATRQNEQQVEPALAPQIFQSELWQVLHKARESAELSYAREFDLVELDRRILFLLRNRGPLVPAGLSSAVGVDKAQVSRSVKRLLELKMVERSQIRAPITLTRKGESLADRLLRLAELRNRELTFDINDRELSEFFSIIEILLDRAVMLYEQERELAHSQGRSEAELIGMGALQERKSGDPVIIDRSRILSPLMTLSSYFMRSAALAYKRLTGLSNFEAWVLTEISKNPPTEWPKLVAALERDHSQAGRTVTMLTDRSLITREGKPGRRHGRFTPTDEGQRLFEIIRETSRKRSAFLMAPLPSDRLSGFLATFEKIRRNTVVQMERERAFDVLERDS
ncbi:MarR family transcriptional regulator [Altericroceibacterium xinjiangense]|uniref:MarR family transcriptional regulator n=1 Tax=Altericroceibacterium xinjiangense TaxID=762261 RepID=UPI000F7E2CA3|nr:MarR family transcriptional regulator [Altericroceibacterium xinjiangense]